MGLVAAIDPGKVSGWALFQTAHNHFGGERASLLRFGTTKSAGQRRTVARYLFDQAIDLREPIAFVFETWPPHGKWGAEVKFSMGESRGRWLEQIETQWYEQADVMSHSFLITKALTNDWRRAMFSDGGRFLKNQKSKVWKSLAVNRARVLWSAENPTGDEAEAICIGEYGCKMPEVVEFLGRA